MKSFLTILVSSILFLPVIASAQDSTGTWSKKSQSISGNWKINGKTLTLSGFATKKGPDLKIFLSPKTLGELKSTNALDGAKLVAKLKSYKRDQTYRIPDGIDLSKYKSIIIHCEKYTKLWGAAALKKK